MLFSFFKTQKPTRHPDSLAIRIHFKNTYNFIYLTSVLLKEDLLGFLPDSMNMDYRDRPFSLEKAFELLGKINNNRGIIFNTKDDSIRLTVSFPTVYSPLGLIWTIKNTEPSDKLIQCIEQITQIENFICCYIYDYWDEYWQSATYNSDYEVYGKAHKHLKRIKNRYGELVIDTTKNVGKLERLRSIDIMAAPIMYFGQWYYDNICSYEKLKSGYPCQELPKKVLKLCLVESIFKPDRNKQASFLEFIQIEKIREQFSIFGEGK